MLIERNRHAHENRSFKQLNVESFKQPKLRKTAKLLETYHRGFEQQLIGYSGQSSRKSFTNSLEGFWWKRKLKNLAIFRNSRRDMCNLQPTALFNAARGVLFMILKWDIKMNYVPHIFMPLVSQSFTTSFCAWSEFTALEVHEQRPVTFF